MNKETIKANFGKLPEEMSKEERKAVMEKVYPGVGLTKDEVEKRVREITIRYNEERKALEGRYLKELRDFCVPYAKSIAKVKIGEPYNGIIVQQIGAKIIKGEVKCVYSGRNNKGEIQEVIDV